MTRASETTLAPAPVEVQKGWGGQSVPRKEDKRLLRGEGVFVDDMKRHGMVYLHFVRSPYAHAHITRVDVSAAEAIDGVYGTLTGEEVAGSQALPIGALWWMTAEEAHGAAAGPDGLVVYCVCPGPQHWCIDGRASNCTLPADTVHRCWIRHGTVGDREPVLRELRRRGIIITTVGPYTNFRDPEGRVEAS